jgi:hydrogenase nickel incorporation protein HypA/HybF
MIPVRVERSVGSSGQPPSCATVHELSIATSLVELAIEAADRAGEKGRIEVVHIRVGSLAGVVIEALEFAWDVATGGTTCAGARLAIERVQGRMRCLACEAETELEDPPRFRCGKCGAATAHIVAGRELDLLSLELADVPEQGEPPPETNLEASHS